MSIWGNPIRPLVSGSIWTADPQWLGYDAGIIASATGSSRSPYTKINNGKTIICTLYNGDDGSYGGDWCDCVTISTDRNSMLFTVQNDSQHVVIYPYIDLNWYVGVAGQNAIYGGATQLTSTYPSIDMNGAQVVIDRGTNPVMIESLFISIMQMAGVRRI